MSATPEKIRVEPGGHAVHFYEDDADLAGIVGRYLGDALAEDATAVVIATEPHARAFECALTAAGFDVEAARASGRLIVLDAPKTLSKLTVDDQINPRSFQRVIGGVVRGACEGRRPPRAYGEIVDLLWKAGDVFAALVLEVLWNALIEELKFSLLCGYHSEPVAAPEHEHALGAVCRLHSSVWRAPAS